MGSRSRCPGCPTASPAASPSAPGVPKVPLAQAPGANRIKREALPVTTTVPDRVPGGCPGTRPPPGCRNTPASAPRSGPAPAVARKVPLARRSTGPLATTALGRRVDLAATAKVAGNKAIIRLDRPALASSGRTVLDPSAAPAKIDAPALDRAGMVKVAGNKETARLDRVALVSSATMGLGPRMAPAMTADPVPGPVDMPRIDEGKGMVLLDRPALGCTGRTDLDLRTTAPATTVAPVRDPTTRDRPAAGALDLPRARNRPVDA